MASTVSTPFGQIYVLPSDQPYMSVIRTDTNKVAASIQLDGTGVDVHTSAKSVAANSITTSAVANAINLSHASGAGRPADSARKGRRGPEKQHRDRKTQRAGESLNEGHGFSRAVMACALDGFSRWGTLFLSRPDRPTKRDTRSGVAAYLLARGFRECNPASSRTHCGRGHGGR
jgi:hypothetical protein